MGASWVTGPSRVASPLVTRDEEGDDEIGGEGAGKDASGILSADKGEDTSCGESMSAPDGDGASERSRDRGGLSDGRKRRLGTPAGSARA
jgi:hypothetical protein